MGGRPYYSSWCKAYTETSHSGYFCHESVMDLIFIIKLSAQYLKVDPGTDIVMSMDACNHLSSVGT